MNKILLALTILGAGAGGFLTAHQSTIQLEREANAAREAWLAQTQLVTVAQSEQAGLMERVRELKQQAQAQPPAVDESALWSSLQTNRADHLPPELRERLLEELGFNWQSSEDFIVVSKQALRDIQMQAIPQRRDGWNVGLTDVVARVLAMTPEERSQVEAAIVRVKTDFRDWTLSHVERHEPKDDVVAHYILPNYPAMSVSNNFAIGLFEAVGRERAELLLLNPQNWMSGLGLESNPMTHTAVFIIKREVGGNVQRFKAEIQKNIGRSSGYLPGASFPNAFRPLFPNGWPDVAKREGFELPEEPQKK